jgi:hypothetical protein
MTKRLTTPLLLSALALAATGCFLDASDESHERSTWESATADEMAPSCGLSCETSADCPGAEPYCNYSLGECQATPPMCATDADCGDEDFCWSDGYCWFMPELNCGPGETVFEGQCDNPACVPERCPEGTLLDEATCACEPVGKAPTCATQTDCDAAYPYCDVEAGVCTTTPPECVSDADCGEAAPHCTATGYCASEPKMNCAPGQVVVEGQCENRVCEASACPEGTVLDAATCDCVATCEAR